MIRDLLAVAAGGALGSSLRWGAGFILPYPFATLAVNVLGSFAIGVVWVMLGPRWHPFLMVGVLGGFTTFSAFSLEVLRLTEGPVPMLALGHVILSLALAFIAVWLGIMAGRYWA